jgi:hypothetical protein
MWQRNSAAVSSWRDIPSQCDHYAIFALGNLKQWSVYL